MEKQPRKRKERKVKEADLPKYSKAERHRRFDPRKWAGKYLKGSSIPAISYVPDPDARDGIKCTVCGELKFADIYGFPNPKTFVCVSCPARENKVKEWLKKLFKIYEKTKNS